MPRTIAEIVEPKKRVAITRLFRPKKALAALLLVLACSGAKARAQQTWSNPAALPWANPATLPWGIPSAAIWIAPNLELWGTHSAALSWIASSTPSVTYNVYRGATTGGPYVQVTAGINSLAWSDRGVYSGSSYFYVVTAFDGISESVYSNEAQAVIP